MSNMLNMNKTKRLMRWSPLDTILDGTLSLFSDLSSDWLDPDISQSDPGFWSDLRIEATSAFTTSSLQRTQHSTSTLISIWVSSFLVWILQSTMKPIEQWLKLQQSWIIMDQ